LDVIIGVGWLSVDSIAGKVLSRRAETVRCLHWLISKADMDWLQDRTENSWANSMLKWTSSIVAGMKGGSTSSVSSTMRISSASKLHQHIDRGHLSMK
jgi:hypothetical protein